MQTTIRSILDFWFGQDSSAIALSKRHKLWFMAKAGADDEIRTRFERHVTAALDGQYMDWCQTPHGRLALILLLDQFTRNIYRKNTQAFAGDTLAIDVCETGITAGHDQELSIPERSFYYMPLEHSESLEHQDTSMRLFAKLDAQSPEEYRTLTKNSYDYAQQHCDIIQRFGRFPHRNTVLGRESTKEELAYLDQSSTHFGQ